MKTIGIIGRGFVGTAVLEGLSHAFTVLSYDKMKGLAIAGEHRSSGELVEEILDGIHPYKVVLDEIDGPIFVCVPTPMNPDGSCNTSIVEEVVDQLALYAAPETVVCIKSTVPPGTTERLDKKYPGINVCFNPEFLREATYIEDFKNQDRIILGGPHAGTQVLKQLFNTAYPDVPVTKTSSTIAEMVKYMTNCFLATKVSFANDMQRICEKLEIDFDKVVEYATKDKRLGTSHWSVPGPDGKPGFSGSCFPKDINALISLASSLEVDVPTLSGAWTTNLKVRPEKDWEQLKGRAVI